MLQIRGGLDLGEKSLCADYCCELWAQYLHCDLAIVPHVLREVHRRHPARTDFAVEAVAIGQRHAEAGGDAQVAIRGRCCRKLDGAIENIIVAAVS